MTLATDVAVVNAVEDTSISVAALVEAAGLALPRLTIEWFVRGVAWTSGARGCSFIFF